jgi:quercetin dioxygenase-like cupin family protein
MQLKRAGSQPSQTGPAEYFTGVVRIDPLHSAAAPARVACASVTFEPGARSAWHTHPLGQTLVVVSGCGWTQCEGEPIVEIRPGDVIWCPPGHRHWHGATPTTSMTHIAIQEALDGRYVEWMEKVTDEQYLASPVRQGMLERPCNAMAPCRRVCRVTRRSHRSSLTCAAGTPQGLSP